MNSIWLRIRPYLSIFVRFMHISYLEARSEYEGTLLGIVWIPVSTLSFALLLGFVFHSPGVMGPSDFFLYVLSGFVVWNFISDSVIKSTGIIQRRLEFAIHNNLTIVGLFAKMLCDRAFEFGLELAVAITFVVILHPFGLGLHTLLIFPLLALLAATSMAVSYLVNLLTLFYPDLGNMVSTAVRLMFFATPVFWMTEHASGARTALETYNPAAYFLAMMRQALGLQPLDGWIWFVGAVIAIVVSIAGILGYRWSETFVRNLR